MRNDRAQTRISDPISQIYMTEAEPIVKASSMIKRILAIFIFVFLGGAIFERAALAQEARIAVAANFRKTADKLVEAFHQNTQSTAITLISGSSGKLAAQILNGAPFDAFLSADIARARHLVGEGKAQTNSLFVYAVGQIYLWHKPRVWPCSPIGALTKGEPIALANDKLAPYGRAAIEALEAMGHGPDSHIYFKADNVAQAYQMVRSGSANLGVISGADAAGLIDKCLYSFPPETYAPIRQAAVLISDNEAAGGFLNFLKGEAAGRIITANGYRLAAGLN